MLAAMVQTGSSLNALCSDMQKMPQTMINVQITDKQCVMNDDSVINAVKQLESEMAGRGRVLLRPS
ncbi:MAG TPA: phosphoglucosamine mutase, partial [Marinobacter adhaerens]|nr:phosphoglucosamine mutase [Marinobacter adhaerens]